MSTPTHKQENSIYVVYSEVRLLLGKGAQDPVPHLTCSCAGACAEYTDQELYHQSYGPLTAPEGFPQIAL